MLTLYVSGPAFGRPALYNRPMDVRKAPKGKIPYFRDGDRILDN